LARALARASLALMNPHRLLVVGCVLGFACRTDGPPASQAGRSLHAEPPVGSVARPARADLYDCEGCEAANERDPATLGWSVVIAGPGEPGDRLIARGTVRGLDGRPAEGVVIYAYHTNDQGLYAGGSAESEWSRRHGRLRGWVKTGADGRYRFETIKPAPYPGQTMPAHLHFTVAEPGRKPYWIDDVVFAGEMGVTDAYRERMTEQGGDGIVTLSRSADGVWQAERDIWLERHPG
jgi:protocatechuate 3,4-dioxygenase beta subunit